MEIIEQHKLGIVDVLELDWIKRNFFSLSFCVFSLNNNFYLNCHDYVS